ncbi:MAG: hypothetical protein IT285_05755 [Bdellovibrionales bacterium]|nr:hypothetical protein [Bdellovibrionales bacterium]
MRRASGSGPEARYRIAAAWLAGAAACLALLAAGPLFAAPLAKASSSPSAEPEPLAKIMGARTGGKAALASVLDSGDPYVHSRLGDSPPEGKLRDYGFTILCRMPAGLELTRSTLKDSKIFAQIPFVKEVTFNSQTQLLKIQGGIWGFELTSFVRFTERGPRWQDYEIAAGSFRGLKGRLIFEAAPGPAGAGQTLVYLDGAHSQHSWPPGLVMEQGAEIVLGVTARRMRSYLVEQKQSAFAAGAKKPKEGSHGQDVPQPRGHLGPIGQ